MKYVKNYLHLYRYIRVSTYVGEFVKQKMKKYFFICNKYVLLHLRVYVYTYVHRFYVLVACVHEYVTSICVYVSLFTYVRTSRNQNVLLFCKNVLMYV